MLTTAFIGLIDIVFIASLAKIISRDKLLFFGGLILSSYINIGPADWVIDQSLFHIKPDLIDDAENCCPAV